MITMDLYEKTLIKPLLTGANRLFIVSGYASATMASRHMNDILEYNSHFKISLIVGMCPEDGLDIATHKGFISLINNNGKVKFECSYIYESPAVHSKVYVWCKDHEPIIAYTGSANYTQPAFSNSRKEVLVECDPEQALNYYKHLIPSTIYCDHGEVEDYITLTNRSYSSEKRIEDNSELEVAERRPQYGSDGDKVTLPLVQRGGEVGARSGLNWGQRPGREPNQAYIPLPSSIARSGFFPLNKSHFTVLTDDNKYLILRVEQQNDKAITTPLNNSLLGEYFRNRLGLANGQYVSRADLERYGRTDVDFYKIDDETFFMDFSVKK
jgi:hypothetical protein